MPLTRGRVAAGLALSVASVARASAHEGHLADIAARQWTFDAVVVIPLIVTAALYAAGLARLWRRAGAGKGMPYWRAASFAAGWLTLAAALVSPVAWLSEILFSVHMTQHTLLMLVAAPLIVFGQPLFVWLWAFDAPARARLTGALVRPAITRPWQALTGPMAVFLENALALWIWHLPRLYQAALRSTAIHAIEHLCLIAAGCAFWWGMVHGRYGRIGYGLAVLYVFLTGVHSSALGALLAVSPRVWYSEYARQAGIWHVDALADQQLAGLIMWIPASVVFIVLGLALFAAWIGESERRVRLGETDTFARGMLRSGGAR
jgi:putative membrane protein